MMKTQIKDSFFNPILHFIPLLTFLAINDFNQLVAAWLISLVIAGGMIFYISTNFTRVLNWHLNFVVLHLANGIAITLITKYIENEYTQLVFGKLFFLTSLILILAFRQKLQQYTNSRMPKLMPMTNNYNELVRIIWILIGLLLINLSAYTLLKFSTPINYESNLLYIHILFVFTATTIIIMETTRVCMIQKNLATEEWWPIVSDQGKIIGSIQKLISLNDEQKFMHPIARVLLIDNNMIYLQKRDKTDLFEPNCWDSAISGHLKVGENIEECVDRIFKDRYGAEGVKCMHLSNYMHEGKKEIHYTFLFVSCQYTQGSIKPLDKNVQTKWWTQKQIEEELNAGIFSQNFKLEFDLLKRSGLLESGNCQCSCRLKDTIYHPHKC